MPLVLANATLASLLPVSLTRAHLGIEDGRIAWIGEELPPAATNVVDCAGRLVMPGNVCAHTHLYSMLARGMPAPPRTPRDFPEILEQVWWRLDCALDAGSIRAAGLVGALEAARCGTTTLVDHHSSPNCIDGSLDLLGEALEEVGLRGVLCYEVTDRGGPERRDAGLAENARFLRRGNRSPTLRGMVGAHASFTLEDDTLARLAELAGELDTGVHVHVAEGICDEEDSMRRCGKRTTQRLHDAGLLRRQSIAAHGVHLDRSELSTIQGAGSWLVHNCRSNMNNAVGAAPVLSFGERSALGTDGIDHDMFAESRSAYLRARERSLEADAGRFGAMLARGSELVSEIFGEPIGSLAVGSVADIAILNYRPPTPLTAANLPWHWMFAFRSDLVDSVLVGGEWVMRRGEFCRVDEEKIRAEARHEAARLWHRLDA